MYLGIDIGGTKTLVASLNDDGSIADQVKFETPDDYQAFLTELRNSLARLPAKDFLYAGIGMPGIIDRANNASTWSGGNLTWKNSPIAKDVGAIANCRAVVENDANVAALSEAKLVKDRYRTALYITLSTGVGSGYVVDGVLDPNTIDAEVGHMIYPSSDSESGYRSW